MDLQVSIWEGAASSIGQVRLSCLLEGLVGRTLFCKRWRSGLQLVWITPLALILIKQWELIGRCRSLKMMSLLTSNEALLFSRKERSLPCPQCAHLILFLLSPLPLLDSRIKINQQLCLRILASIQGSSALLSSQDSRWLSEQCCLPLT